MKTIQELLRENHETMLELKEAQIKNLKEQIEIIDRMIEINKNFLNNK